MGKSVVLELRTRGDGEGGWGMAACLAAAFVEEIATHNATYNNPRWTATTERAGDSFLLTEAR